MAESVEKRREEKDGIFASANCKSDDQEFGRKCWAPAYDHEARSTERRSEDLGGKKNRMSGYWTDVTQRRKKGQSIGNVTKACRTWETSLGK